MVRQNQYDLLDDDNNDDYNKARKEGVHKGENKKISKQVGYKNFIHVYDKQGIKKE